MPVVTLYVSCKYPLHPPAKIAVIDWPQHEMKVVRHDAIANNPHPHSFVSFVEQLAKGREVSFFVKDLLSIIAPTQYVVTITPNCLPFRSRHLDSLRTNHEDPGIE